jgi:tetratricopeptide (TPR) repeat protein
LEAAEFAWRRKAAFNHGTRVEAEASIEASRRGLAALPFPTPAWFVHRLDYLAADIRCTSGDTESCLALMESSVPTLIANTQTAGEVMQIQFNFGVALREAGRHDEADALLRKLLEARRLAGTSRHPYAGGQYVYVAANLRMKGDYIAAATVLDAVPEFDAITGEGGVNPRRYQRMIEWERARLLLDEARPAAALALLKTQAPLAGEFDFDLFEYEQVLGAAMCGTGANAQGLVHLKKALVMAKKDDDLSPNTPWIAHLRARTALCAAAAGDMALAREQARLARASFNAQPGVSPYYKKPSQQLDRLLGIRPPSPGG